MTQHLFVYGSLAPGRPNEHILAPLDGTWLPATIQGFLRQQGWGAALGYPGLVLDSEGDEIQGFLFTSADLGGFWPSLDEFEGEQYKRAPASVRPADGQSVEAWVYLLRGN